MLKNKLELLDVLEQVNNCRRCADDLSHTPRPVLQAAASARLLIIGQAPGTKVHASGIPWNDRSGDVLRDWLGLSPEVFYDENQVAIMPMGFCYPGKGASGDLPPRRECAPEWHERVLAGLPEIRLTLLIGLYAQRYYLKGQFSTLTNAVQNWQQYLPQFFVLPHPSPRNQAWRMHHPWFEAEVVPDLKRQVKACLANRGHARRN
jgi:uracil-DNA glycosylase